MTLRQLIVELRERSGDLDISVKVEGNGNIVDIEFTDDGELLIMGEQDE